MADAALRDQLLLQSTDAAAELARAGRAAHGRADPVASGAQVHQDRQRRPGRPAHGVASRLGGAPDRPPRRRRTARAELSHARRPGPWDARRRTLRRLRRRPGGAARAHPRRRAAPAAGAGAAARCGGPHPRGAGRAAAGGDRRSAPGATASSPAPSPPPSRTPSASRSAGIPGRSPPPSSRCSAPPSARRSPRRWRAWSPRSISALEHSLSPRGLRWRLEAWRTGVPVRPDRPPSRAGLPGGAGLPGPCATPACCWPMP